jgi:predicted AAA+ superfamily ATPase
MQIRIFKRKIYEMMLQWKRNSNGRTALLIKGARRVGKSTIVEKKTKKEYKNYVFIDFSSVSNEFKELFNDMSDLNYFFLRLQLLANINLVERESVIIFDEVQLCPLARQAVKHLVKDGRYDYIETGSLLSIKKNIKGILIPSEETRINMFPMDYEEFRWALGDDVTIPLLKKAYESKQSLGEVLHRKLMRDFRLYMLIGGMPQAVNEYLNTNNFQAVDLIKRTVLELYEEDFRKIDDTGGLSLLFNAIPAELSKNSCRYQVSTIDANLRVNRVASDIADMLDSMTVNIAYHSTDPSVGMALTKDISRFKLFLADTGLFVTLVFMDKDFTDNVIYQKLLNDKSSTNLGYIYENVIAQSLRTSGNELYYYTFPSEASNRKYEIDFLLSHQNKICPIELKSSGYKTHKSLDMFVKKYSKRVSNKYLVYTKDMNVNGDITMLPMYMVPFL